ncbi:MAG: VOC family protein [Phenylobacterium sp.]|uniref:VOC family protein n=1 Tax=Phenylobacterium sp. TaxID=1871053 RepID=UPI00122637EB|nr:VOC family protein [Phenylobacterium sp.]TAJ70619.1 MAG: VOC family protein [Phenylobacterium sp.]
MTRNPPLHHVGIVQATEEEALALMTLMGLEEDYRGFVPQFSALCIFTKAATGSPIEFVVPDGGPLAKFNKGAGGLHHIALEVPDLDALQRGLEAEGMKLLEAEHVKGAGDFLCNFLSPVYTRGITIEFVQLLAKGTEGPPRC